MTARKNGLSRRDLLKVTAAMGLGAAASTVAVPTTAAAEKRDLTYRQVLDAAPWSARSHMGVVVFEDRLWVLGGITGEPVNGTMVNDVWSSEDGLQWRQELASAPWHPRCSYGVFAFAGKLWVIGGLASLNPLRNLNDIWSSADGKKWTREETNAPWTGRHGLATTIHRDRMYLLGGATDGSHYYQDVISSDDGNHWRLEPVLGAWFEKRKDLTAASYHGNIILGGGSIIDPSQRGGSRALNDVWSSQDGRAWTCVPHAPWSPMSCHRFVIYMGKLWLVGGVLMSGRYATDLWSTPNGEDWGQETDHFAWPVRHSWGIVTFKNKVWIAGGARQGASSLNDIWTFEADK